MSAAASISTTLARNLRRKVGPRFPSKWDPQTSPFSTSAPAISTLSQHEQEKRGRSTWSKILLFIPGAITFGLGTWQIFRRQEKIKMLEYRQSRLEIEPLKGSELVPSSVNLDTLEFRRVKFKGVFDDKKSIYIGPRSRSISGVTENGYYLITPLIPVPGDTESAESPILVNRGWVPRSWRDKALYSSEDVKELSSKLTTTNAQETEKASWWHFWSNKPVPKERHADITAVEVIGVIRGSEKPSIFVPSNDPNNSQWFYIDVPEIARACGLPEKTVYIEDINDNINPSNPYPIPKDANTLIRSSVMPQDHLNYTITWYSLSGAVTFMAIKLVKPIKRIRK